MVTFEIEMKKKWWFKYLLEPLMPSIFCFLYKTNTLDVEKITNFIVNKAFNYKIRAQWISTK